MAGETKMIIITSDEDLIEELSTKTNPSTHIIDLDDQNPMTGMTKDNNLINLAFIAQLSEINSKIDRAYKRALDTPVENPSKSVRMSKKSINSICRVCGDRAIGFNYDVLSCGSCKGFFRRNAHQNLETLKCLKGDLQCSVEYKVRRKCARCRLDRCFAVGMRKDFIMSDEEIRARKERLQQVRNRSSTSEAISTSSSNTLSESFNEIDQLLIDMDRNDDHLSADENTNLKEIEESLFETLSIEDWLAIENVRSAFISAFENDHTNDTSLDLSNPASALISWSHYFDDVALRFIRFLRQLDQFEHLDADDRFVLIKYNFLCIFPICRCFDLESIDHHSWSQDIGFIEMSGGLLIACGASTGIQQIFVNIVSPLTRLCDQDSTLLILIMTVLSFTQGLSMNEDEPFLNDPLAVNRAQLHYTTLLWKYLINKRGEMEARKCFIQLMKTIFLLQSETKTFQKFFRVQMVSSETVDQIAPLLQTVLNIS